MNSKDDINPLSTKLTKWPNTLKQFVGNLLTNCLSVFGHFVGLALKTLSVAGRAATFRVDTKLRKRGPSGKFGKSYVM